jgi:hypothetical protein
VSAPKLYFLLRAAVLLESMSGNFDFLEEIFGLVLMSVGNGDLLALEFIEDSVVVDVVAIDVEVSMNGELVHGQRGRERGQDRDDAIRETELTTVDVDFEVATN